MKALFRIVAICCVVAAGSVPVELQAEETCTPCSTQQHECANVGGTTPTSCYQAYIICTCMVCNSLCDVHPE